MTPPVNPETAPDPNLPRRQFLLMGTLAGSGLMVACGSADPRAMGQAEPPGKSPGGVAVNAWVRIDPQGLVTVAVPRSEMGQGVHTSLAQLVAEELEAQWADVRVESPPPGRAYANTSVLSAALPLQPDDESWIARIGTWTTQQAAVLLSLNVTGGSTSVRAAWGPMRWAGASARSVLEQTAARLWGVPASQCRAREGQVHHDGSGRKAGFGELVQRWAERPLEPASDLALKPRSQWRLIGTSPQRLDTPDKTFGRAAFGADIQLPDLRHAALRMCPYGGGRLVKVEDARARAMSGVRAVHAFADWPVPTVAVVAESTWQAQRAAAALEIDWDGGLGIGSGRPDATAPMRQALEQDEGVKFRNLGDAPARLAQAESQVVEADYQVPFLAHATMELPNATARLTDGRLELWTGTQVPILARWAAARAADLPIEAVTLHPSYLGGGFGRRLEVDVIEQVTHLAMKTAPHPVRVQWTREQDLQHDAYRPAAAARLRAGLRQGRLDALHIKVAAPSVTDSYMRRILPAALAGPMPVSPDKSQIEGAFDLPYAVPNLRASQVLVPATLPVGYWRSVGHSYNAFFTECFLDEVAQALNQDPLDFRLGLLADRPRHRAVLQAVARLSEWRQAPAPGRARGLALHESFGAICAQVADVSLVEGRPRVHRVCCALDAGTLIHPDTVRAQLESAIVFGLSAALWGQVPVVDGRVDLRGWADYPVVRMADMPEILIHLIDSPAPPGGVGEPGTPPVAPAVANALSRLDGRRRRELPLTTSSG